MRYRYQSAEKVYNITIERKPSGYLATIDGVPFEFEVLSAQPGELSLRFGDKTQNITWAADGSRRWFSMQGCSYVLEKPTRRSRRAASEIADGDTIHSPMPAQVREVMVSAGEEVQKGQTLALLEAMKMEIRIQAPRNGRVLHLPIVQGQPVERDQVLVVIA